MSSNDITSPDTTIALMQVAQSGNAQATKKLNQSKQLEKIAGAAEEFEAVFIAEMMKPMFEGISTEAPFGGGKGEEIFRSMLLQEYGTILAKSGGIGISRSVQTELLKAQEQSTHDTALPQ
jgi:Rod binding domain-containing protein